MNKEKIIVIRKKRLFETRYSVGIYIDGEFVVNTLESNTQEILLEPGQHILEVKQGNRSGKIEIEVKKGKTLTCVFTSSTKMNVISILFILGALFSYLDPPNDDIGIFLYILGAILTLYTFTRGRSFFFIFEEPIEEYSWLMDQ